MNKPFLTSGCAFICILFGSALYYFHGHKNAGILNESSYVVIVAAWIVASLPLAKWFTAKRVSIVGYILVPVCAVANIVFVMNLNAARVERILAGDPVSATTGTITEIESRSRRSSTKVYATIRYLAGNEQIEQEIVDDRGEYAVGQQFEIKYSVEHPEMFELQGLLNNVQATDF